MVGVGEKVGEERMREEVKDQVSISSPCTLRVEELLSMLKLNKRSQDKEIEDE